MVDVGKQQETQKNVDVYPEHERIARFLDENPSADLKQADENKQFEYDVATYPLKNKYPVDVFGESWDIRAIMKGNYWGRNIYTTDKICKMFLKWLVKRQMKYLEKKNALSFDYWWVIVLLLIAGVAFIVVVMVIIPMVTGGVTLF